MGSEEVMADETGVAMDELMAQYQTLLDLNEAMDGDNHEANIKKQLHVAGMTDLAEIKVSQISGGEYKLLQIMKEMLLAPNLLVLDEPDVFLDFANLGSLAKLINGYKGTLLVITHNRYLLNHCFNKMLHLENCDIQEFDGNYTEYRCAQLREKLRLQAQYVEEQDEIARTEEMVDILRTRASKMVNPVIGRSVNAKQSQLDRLLARQIKAPFIEISEPDIVLPQVQSAEAAPILSVSGYQVSFDKELLQDVEFQLMRGEKVAIVGANGTGKTTMLRDIYRNNNSFISMADDVEIGFLSQIHGEMLNESNTIYEEFESIGFETHGEIAEYLKDYYFEVDMLSSPISQLSGGEKNLLQLAKIAAGKANLLLLDEPTSHLDTYSQIALEKAIAEYKGTVLMVSHDFYTIANCVDYILFVEDKTVRKMRTRSFRKMIYENHFSKDYLEQEQQKKELETRIEKCLKENDYETAKGLCEKLEAVVDKLN